MPVTLKQVLRPLGWGGEGRCAEDVSVWLFGMKFRARTPGAAKTLGLMRSKRAAGYGIGGLMRAIEVVGLSQAANPKATPSCQDPPTTAALHTPSPKLTPPRRFPRGRSDTHLQELEVACKAPLPALPPARASRPLLRCTRGPLT